MVDPGANGTNALGPIMPFGASAPDPGWAWLAGVFLWPAGRVAAAWCPHPAAAGPQPPPGLAPAPWRSYSHTLGATVSTCGRRLRLRSGACVGLSAVASGLILQPWGGC